MNRLVSNSNQNKIVSYIVNQFEIPIILNKIQYQSVNIKDANNDG